MATEQSMEQTLNQSADDSFECEEIEEAVEINTKSIPPLEQPKINHLVPTNDDETRIVNETHGKDSWQARILHIVHRSSIQRFLMVLLLIDVMLLFAELYLSAEFPTCKVIMRDALSCYPKDEESKYGSESDYGKDYDNDGHRSLGGGGYGSLCPDPYTE
eukprot:12992685-Ditylum_brightwellii.AAC.1